VPILSTETRSTATRANGRCIDLPPPGESREAPARLIAAHGALRPCAIDTRRANRVRDRYDARATRAYRVKRLRG
jgi:hypothetical protein